MSQQPSNNTQSSNLATQLLAPVIAPVAKGLFSASLNPSKPLTPLQGKKKLNELPAPKSTPAAPPPALPNAQPPVALTNPIASTSSSPQNANSVPSISPHPIPSVQPPVASVHPTTSTSDNSQNTNEGVAPNQVDTNCVITTITQVRKANNGSELDIAATAQLIAKDPAVAMVVHPNSRSTDTIARELGEGVGADDMESLVKVWTRAHFIPFNERSDRVTLETLKDIVPKGVIFGLSYWYRVGGSGHCLTGKILGEGTLKFTDYQKTPGGKDVTADVLNKPLSNVFWWDQGSRFEDIEALHPGLGFTAMRGSTKYRN